MAYIVYILKSTKNPVKSYIGITQNLEQRLQEHNSGLSYYTKRYVPWDVETYIVFKNKDLAERFECYLKEGSGQAFLIKRLLPKINKAK